jgi:hypothetical protein
LNDIPIGSGGGTKFYHDEAVNKLHQDASSGRWTAEQQLCFEEVHPKAGRLLYFDQRYVHEGVSPLNEYEKYIIRTDIMYSRTPALLTGDNDRLAFEWQMQAEQLAEEGDIDTSISLFKRAYKLSPELSKIMGQS